MKRYSSVRVKQVRWMATWMAVAALAILCAPLVSIQFSASAQSPVAQNVVPPYQPAGPIQLSVDLSEAPRHIFHAHLIIPATPGPFTLAYPKWIPGEHMPDGPISDLAGLHFTAGGKTLAWHRDSVDMYQFHMNVPAGATSLEASLDYLNPVDGNGFSAGPSATSQVSILEWNDVLLYPAGVKSDDLTYVARFEIACWMEIRHVTAESADAGRCDSVWARLAYHIG